MKDSTRDFLVVGWDDTRNVTQLTQTQDLFTVDVQFRQLGGGTSTAARVAFAAVVGIGRVGLVLLSFSVMGRRRA